MEIPLNVVILTKENIPEMAEKTGRSVEELEKFYQDKIDNNYVAFVCTKRMDLW